ncbi:hypothetical protein [Burkholderia ubonensis]|uniref:hypothetical protein n=1 Tax=Burkholderia ubonensis TaxID=101571 RepID=UPI0012FCC007|nr:hypothetical protein [Burkholderia ubonensis]
MLLADVAEQHCQRDKPALSRRHDYPFKLGFRGTCDRDARRGDGAAGELTPVFATPGPVTTLLRDTQAYEFAKILRFPADAARRSDTFTSQTVTILFLSTPFVRRLIVLL